jgi:hypothetical protein
LFKLHFTQRRQDVNFSVSLGVVNDVRRYRSPADALRDARLASKTAQADGGWRYQVFGDMLPNGCG